MGLLLAFEECVCYSCIYTQFSSTQTIWPSCLAALSLEAFGDHNHSVLPLRSLWACEQGSRGIPYGNKRVVLLWSPRDDVSLKPFYVSKTKLHGCLKPVQLTDAILSHNKVSLWIYSEMPQGLGHATLWCVYHISLYSCKSCLDELSLRCFTFTMKVSNCIKYNTDLEAGNVLAENMKGGCIRSIRSIVSRLRLPVSLSQYTHPGLGILVTAVWEENLTRLCLKDKGTVYSIGICTSRLCTWCVTLNTVWFNQCKSLGSKY